MRSAPWRSATTPSCSACAAFIIEAQRRKDTAAARAYAEEAANAAPALGWAGQAVLEFRCAAGDWAAALSALDRNSRYGLIDKTEYKRQRAVLLTARALAAADGERDRARSLALDALKLAPTLVPAAELAGRLLGEAGELRRASRIIEKAWAANPHPDLAETYAHLRPGDSARERLARVQSLALKAPGQGAAHIESALAVARAALDAQEFAVARNAIRPLLKEPTQRVADLDGGDRAARERRRGPRPRMDGAGAARAARSGVERRRLRVGSLDAGVAGERAARRVPVEGAAGGTGRRARGDRGRRAGCATAPPVVVAAAAGAAARSCRRNATPAEPSRRPPTAGRAVRFGAEAAEVAPRVEAVIPLLHVPDDPGPDPAPDLDPEPEPPGGSRGLAAVQIGIAARRGRACLPTTGPAVKTGAIPPISARAGVAQG